MQIIRTVIWVMIAIAVTAFLIMNWGQPAQVLFWPLENDALTFEWPVGVIALVFFLLGLLPMWLLHRAGRWRLNRRIASLENSVRAVSTTPSAPLATSTQLEAAATDSAPTPPAPTA